MSSLALSDSFEYLCYGSTASRNIFKSTASDVYRRQILSTNVDPRALRAKTTILFMLINDNQVNQTKAEGYLR